eukprot:7648155-Pyramimonas_sp.AAC.1
MACEVRDCGSLPPPPVLPSLPFGEAPFLGLVRLGCLALALAAPSVAFAAADVNAAARSCVLRIEAVYLQTTRVGTLSVLLASSSQRPFCRHAQHVVGIFITKAVGYSVGCTPLRRVGGV